MIELEARFFVTAWMHSAFPSPPPQADQLASSLDRLVLAAGGGADPGRLTPEAAAGEEAAGGRRAGLGCYL